MNRFSIGERVVALTNPSEKYSQPRIKGKTYTVLAVKYCVGCGIQDINVAGNSSIDFTHEICGCGLRTIAEDNMWWTSSNNFARLTDLEAELKTAVENEDYETAAMIRDIKI